jgi:hypothetical protein
MMIEKEAGNRKIHRLRVIHIYEADYNLLLCVKWRQATHHASRANLLNPSQNGSRPGFNAPDIPFVEELEYEICRATRTPLGKFDNDATSCYDRIHCFLGNIASQKYGIDRKICIVQGKTLAQAKYYLRTQLGVSEGWIQHSQAYPIYGTGQGSGNSSVYWLFVSSTLFDCHELKAHGAVFSTPDRQTTIKLCMMGFVDDTSNRTNHFELNNQPTMEELIMLMQHDAQIWNDILRSSGGELELSKCTFHHIRFTFDYKGRPSLIPGKFSPNLRLRNTQGEHIQIQQLANTDSHKLLGCHKSPEGDQKAQFAAIRDKCKEFAKTINNSPLDRHESAVFYRHIYIPSVTYPLSSTFFTDKQCQQLQTQANRSLTQRCGYSAITPLNLLYGPTLYGCPQFTNIYTTQSCQQLQMFIKHWRTDRQPGRMLRICMAWWQLIAGTSTPILETPSTKLPHFDSESKFIASIRQYLASIRAHLTLDQTYIPELQREGDEHIMDRVLSSNKFSTTEIKYANLCRLYLQVVTVADISMANGRELDRSIKAGSPCLLSAHT